MRALGVRCRPVQTTYNRFRSWSSMPKVPSFGRLDRAGSRRAGGVVTPCFVAGGAPGCGPPVATSEERADNRFMSSSSAGSGDGEAAPAGPTGPSVTVAGVARRLGVAPATLRTWDRRYGLGPTEHAAGAHRRYTPADVSRLEVMRRLVLDGVAPADAARAALATPAPAPGQPVDQSAPAPVSAQVDHSDVASGRGG